MDPVRGGVDLALVAGLADLAQAGVIEGRLGDIHVVQLHRLKNAHGQQDLLLDIDPGVIDFRFGEHRSIVAPRGPGVRRQDFDRQRLGAAIRHLEGGDGEHSDPARRQFDPPFSDALAAAIDDTVAAALATAQHIEIAPQGRQVRLGRQQLALHRHHQRQSLVHVQFAAVHAGAGRLGVSGETQQHAGQQRQQGDGQAIHHRGASSEGRSPCAARRRDS